MSLLRDLGMNAIRLRVWVNPENDTDDVRVGVTKEMYCSKHGEPITWATVS